MQRRVSGQGFQWSHYGRNRGQTCKFQSLNPKGTLMRTILGLRGRGKEESQREVMRLTIAIAAGMSPVGGMEEAPVPCPKLYSPEGYSPGWLPEHPRGGREWPGKWVRPRAMQEKGWLSEWGLACEGSWGLSTTCLLKYAHHQGRGKRSPELTALRWEERGFKIEIPEKERYISDTPATMIILLSAACCVITAKLTPFSSSWSLPGR